MQPRRRATIRRRVADITELLNRWHGGDGSAFDELMPLVYRELHAMAAALLRGERRADVLETGALVHEAYLRLVDQTRIHWNGRAHFFGAAAQVMRRILVDQARRRLATKRGAGAAHESLDVAVTIALEPDLNVLALNEALDRLAHTDAELARLVEMRYFAGLTLDETAEVLGISVPTVKRDWNVARAWLARQLADARKPGLLPGTPE
jgi:RNA polymerase sigma factor (TIGR02999 family)